MKDSLSKRTGELMGVIEQRTKDGKLVKVEACLRPKGDGREWEVPLGQLNPVRGHS
jgi:hypothetical protein